MRSAGFEPAIPSLGSSYLNQAGLTSLASTDGEFGIIRLLFTSTRQIGIGQLHAIMKAVPRNIKTIARLFTLYLVLGITTI
jgi:hypothetical protein